MRSSRRASEGLLPDGFILPPGNTSKRRRPLCPNPQQEGCHIFSEPPAGLFYVHQSNQSARASDLIHPPISRSWKQDLAQQFHCQNRESKDMGIAQGQTGRKANLTIPGKTGLQANDEPEEAMNKISYLKFRPYPYSNLTQTACLSKMECQYQMGTFHGKSQ
jgi:hypothetical protein